MDYLEQTSMKLLNLVDNHCGQYYNKLVLLRESLNDVYFHHFYL